MKNYYSLVEERFEFLSDPGEMGRLRMLGFYKKFPVRKDPWCFQCGYWNTWFILSFQIDFRDRLHILSLSRRSSGDVLKSVEYYDLEKLLTDQIPGRISPDGGRLDEDGVRLFLDSYATAFRGLDSQALTPMPGEGLGEWSYDEFERYRVEDGSGQTFEGL